LGNQLKGKIILLDFYFIGCLGCMEGIKPLNDIYEKYKNKNVVIASLTYRDSKKAVLDFDKQYGIKSPGYVGASTVVKEYKVSAFPTFYVIDNEGNIANTIVGYNHETFINDVTTTIDSLIINK
jgi:thiol-disulfide isomerase/thioredoxin